MQKQQESLAILNQDGDVLEGWLQELEKPQLGTNYVLMGDGIEAFLKLKEGSDINLREFHWRRVQVTGEEQMVDHEVAPEYRGVPLIVIDKIRMTR